jgi:hypothetical protein
LYGLTGNIQTQISSINTNTNRFQNTLTSNGNLIANTLTLNGNLLTNSTTIIPTILSYLSFRSNIEYSKSNIVNQNKLFI